MEAGGHGTYAGGLPAVTGCGGWRVLMTSGRGVYGTIAGNPADRPTPLSPLIHKIIDYNGCTLAVSN